MKQFSSIAAALALCVSLAACGSGADGLAGGSGDPASTSNVRILVTDAPFPANYVRSASIVIREVRVHERDLGTWHTVYEGSSTIDLVPLTGGVSSLLADVELAAGTYDEVRLLVDAGEVVLEDEAVVSTDSHVFNVGNGGLHFPSAAQSGVKVKIDNDLVVVTELTSDLTLDFDLTKNFVFNGPVAHAPGVRRVIFTPVVRAVNSSTAGSLKLEILSDNATPGVTTDDAPLTGAGVSALDAAGDEVGSGVTGADGVLLLQLPPGTYTLAIEAADHESATTGAQEVFVANLTDAGSVLLAATGGEVTGTVMSDGATSGDTADDVVVSGVTIEAVLQGETDAAATTTTDAQGAFRFESLDPGTYDLVVRGDGFAEETRTDIVPTLGGTGVSVLLTAWTRNLTGTVTDSDDAALEGVTVVATNAAGVQIGSTTTDADGLYALALPTGVHTVVFLDAGSGASSSPEVTVSGTDPETDQALDVQLATAPG